VPVRRRGPRRAHRQVGVQVRSGAGANFLRLWPPAGLWLPAALPLRAPASSASTRGAIPPVPGGPRRPRERAPRASWVGDRALKLRAGTISLPGAGTSSYWPDDANPGPRPIPSLGTFSRGPGASWICT
jgi:hypothetical protein